MHRLKKWFKRYFLAEIVGTVFALVSSLGVYSFTKNNVLAALAGAWLETIGFFGTMIIRDIIHSKIEHRESNMRYTLFSFLKNARDIVFEFGFSEIMDTWAIRPFMMYLFPLIIPNRILGVLVGKLVSDVIYFAPAIIVFELREKQKRKKEALNHKI